MSNQIYNWKRFWCPRAGRISLSDGGYLYDSDSKWGQIHNPDMVILESIADIPCLGLLGEPGIGKTQTMQAERKSIDTKIEKEGDRTLWVDLRSCGSESTLFRKLFDSETFVSWVNGKHRLHIFLDSLDECLLRIGNLSALLIDEFQNYPVKRLYLRIACRTADWPNGLENGLKEIWDDKAVKIYELAPLRRIDVVEAAKANNLDPDEFLGEIDHKEVVPFAIKPVTLNFLINTYSRKGQLPSTQAELYLEGCRILCEETNENRRDARLIGDFTAEQRMAIASRIAAVTVFANRYVIWTGVDQGDVPEEDIMIRELYGRSRSEKVDNEQFKVTKAAVEKTLDTGLFSSRGQERMGWAHQTYAEFLAARYLVQHRMIKDQIMNLIVHPGDFEGKLVPQLHETAAWLANMKPDVFQEIMKTDPEVLLRSDVASADVKDRVALVDNLLKLYDEEKLLDNDLDIRRRYRKLAHPDLAKQIRPYICDDTKGIIVRRVAIDIAEACELRVLQRNLLDIALDASQQMIIRINAADAVSRIGDDKTKTKLKPLATGEAEGDPNDELKGCALFALWPDWITAEELFSVLTPNKKSFFGAYWRFLSQGFIQYLQPSDLPVALKWVEKQPPRKDLTDNLGKLMDEIMLTQVATYKH